ncbi:MAG TPA: hypothetical protein VMV53_06095 [Acidimicrobiales bacterium]|nr:hypothetical protein [Acidimicrobiales bacterium]
MKEIQHMPVGEVDVFSSADAARLAAENEGPRVSIFLPTERRGDKTRQAAIRLRNLLADAQRQLRDAGMSTRAIDDLLAPEHALALDDDFWQHQSDGLALFAAPGLHLHYRVPLHLVEEATVARGFRVRPLAPLLSGDGRFFIMALSQNEVRVYEATRLTIGELDTSAIVKSMADALAMEESERQLQYHSSGSGTVHFHGHGAGEEIDKGAVERYLRVVDRGLREALDGSTEPLVLASVDYYQPIFRSMTRYPNVWDQAITGAPERWRPEELHEMAWTIMAPHFAGEGTAALARYRQGAGTGATTTDLDEIVLGAREGRVDTLLVTTGAPVWGRVDEEARRVMVDETRSADDEDVIDRALLETLSHGGSVVSLEPSELATGSAAAALLRY